MCVFSEGLNKFIMFSSVCKAGTLAAANESALSNRQFLLCEGYGDEIMVVVMVIVQTALVTHVRVSCTNGLWAVNAPLDFASVQ